VRGKNDAVVGKKSPDVVVGKKKQGRNVPMLLSGRQSKVPMLLLGRNDGEEKLRCCWEENSYNMKSCCREENSDAVGKILFFEVDDRNFKVSSNLGSKSEEEEG